MCLLLAMVEGFATMWRPMELMHHNVYSLLYKAMSDTRKTAGGNAN